MRATVSDGRMDRRRSLVEDIVARTGIDEALIERVVRAFYDRVAGDPSLGPIFAARIDDWEAHIARMCDFWSSIVLMSGRYHGQPTRAHKGLPVSAAHFDRWLELFKETVDNLCRPEGAAHLLARANRIAESLELAIGVREGYAPPRRRYGTRGMSQSPGGFGAA